MHSWINEMTKNLKKRQGASEEAISSLKCMCERLPEEYIEFLRTSNGAEGFIGNGYLSMWSAEDVVSLNQKYRVQEFAPGLLLFASDGGGTGYGFDCRTSNALPIVDVTFVGLSFDESIPRGNTFGEFLEFVSNQR